MVLYNFLKDPNGYNRKKSVRSPKISEAGRRHLKTEAKKGTSRRPNWWQVFNWTSPSVVYKKNLLRKKIWCGEKPKSVLRWLKIIKTRDWFLLEIMYSGVWSNGIGFCFLIRIGSIWKIQMAITTTGGICEVKKRFYLHVNVVVAECVGIWPLLFADILCLTKYGQVVFSNSTCSCHV